MKFVGSILCLFKLWVAFKRQISNSFGSQRFIGSRKLLLGPSLCSNFQFQKKENLLTCFIWQKIKLQSSGDQDNNFIFIKKIKYWKKKINTNRVLCGSTKITGKLHFDVCLIFYKIIIFIIKKVKELVLIRVRDFVRKEKKFPQNISDRTRDDRSPAKHNLNTQ